MTNFAKLLGAAVALFALWGLRAWIVLAGAFFGVAVLRSVPGAVRDREFLDAFLLFGTGALCLLVSFRWFAQRWTGPAKKPDENV